MVSKLDKPYLESILKLSISNFEISEGSKAGDNMAGNIKSIKVFTAKGGLDIVYKSIPLLPEARNYATQFGIFAIENTMYKIIVPQIDKLINKTLGVPNIYPNEFFLPMPWFFGGNYNPTNPDEDYICLEDVRSEGYVMPDKFKSLSLPEVNLIMKELGKFHAKSYFWIKVEGEKIFDENNDLNRYKHNRFTIEDPEMVLILSQMMKNETNNALSILKHQNQLDLASRLKTRLVEEGENEPGKLFKRASALLKQNKTFPCIIHGDLWANNIMIKYDSSANPVDLKFIDFQLSRRGNIFEDLGYFFFCSTTPEFRKNHLLQALNTYFESFASTLDILKCPLPLGFTRGSLIDTFFEGRLGYYVYMLMAIPMQLAKPIDPTEAATNTNGGPTKEGHENEIPTGEEDNKGPNAAIDPSQMILKGLEMRSKVFLGQMLKSPFAMNRLVELTKEIAEAKFI